MATIKKTIAQLDAERFIASGQPTPTATNNFGLNPGAAQEVRRIRGVAPLASGRPTLDAPFAKPKTAEQRAANQAALDVGGQLQPGTIERSQEALIENLKKQGLSAGQIGQVLEDEGFDKNEIDTLLRSSGATFKTATTGPTTGSETITIKGPDGREQLMSQAAFDERIARGEEFIKIDQSVLDQRASAPPAPGLAPTTVQGRGTRILNEEDLQARREELASAGIPEEDFSKFISSPTSDDPRLFFRQPATLTSPTGEKRIVASGSQEANDLFKSGFTLGEAVSDDPITSKTVADTTTINIGDDTIPTTFESDTVAGGFDATISSANDEVERLQKLLISEVPETPGSEELKALFDSLDPDTLTGRGATQLSEEEKRGIEEKTQALLSKTAELKRKSDEINALTQSFNQANTEAEGRPQTLSRLRGVQAQNYRMYLAQKNSLTADAAFIQSDLLAMQNQLEASQDAANRAVDLMFSDRLDAYNATISKINILQPQVAGDEARYLAGIQLDLENQQAELAEQKQGLKDVQNLKLSYIETMLKAGQDPDPGVLSSFSKAQTVDQAIDILGKSLPQATSPRLSVAEAKSLGVPFGTTEAEAFGITPGAGVGGVGGTGLTRAKLATAKSNYLATNPSKTSADFDALSNDDKLRWSVGGPEAGGEDAEFYVIQIGSKNPTYLDKDDNIKWSAVPQAIRPEVLARLQEEQAKAKIKKVKQPGDFLKKVPIIGRFIK